MQIQIEIRTVGDKLHLVAPYSASNNKRYRSIGAFFDSASKEWVFPDNENARLFLRESFGEPDSEIVAAKIDSTMTVERDDSLYILATADHCAEYKIASRRFRDAPAKLEEGVTLESGRLSSSGGSQKNPAVRADDNVVFRVAMRREFAERIGAVPIEKETVVKSLGKNKTAVVILEASSLPYQPRIERIDAPPSRPSFRTVYGAEIILHGRDDLGAFEEHGRNCRHAAECAGLLDTD